MSLVSVQDLWRNTTEDLRFAKRQQWTVAYYSMLVYAAILGFATLLKDPCAEQDLWFVKRSLVGVTILSTVLGSIYLMSFHVWIRKSRKYLNVIQNPDSKFATEGFKKAYKEMNPAGKISLAWWKDIEVVVFLTVFHCFAASGVLWVLAPSHWKCLVLRFTGLLLVSGLLSWLYYRFKVASEPKNKTG